MPLPDSRELCQSTRIHYLKTIRNEDRGKEGIGIGFKKEEEIGTG